MALLLTNKTPSGTYRGPGPLRGGFLPRAAVRHGGERSRHRPRRIPPPQPHRRARDAVSAADRCSRSTRAARPTAATTGMTLDRCLADFGWAEKSKLQGKLIDGRYHGIARRLLSRRRRLGPARERAHGARARRHGVASTSARRRSGRASRPCSRRSPPTRSTCRWRASTACSTARPLLKQGYGSYRSRSIVMGGSAIVQAAALAQGRDPRRGGASARLRAGRRSPSTATAPSARPRLGRARRRSPPTASRPTAPSPATSAPTATARTPPMSRSIPAPATSRSSTTWRSRTSAASSIR